MAREYRYLLTYPNQQSVERWLFDVTLWRNRLLSFSVVKGLHIGCSKGQAVEGGIPYEGLQVLGIQTVGVVLFRRAHGTVGNLVESLVGSCSGARLQAHGVSSGGK